MSETKKPRFLGGRALLISGPILLSRILAVAREQMLAALLGAGAAPDHVH